MRVERAHCKVPAYRKLKGFGCTIQGCYYVEPQRLTYSCYMHILVMKGYKTVYNAVYNYKFQKHAAEYH